MLKFIDENDFLLVDKYKQNEDDSVSWSFNDGESFHSGGIFEGFTREDGESTIDVWAKFQELVNDGTIIVEVPSDEDLSKKAYDEAVSLRQSAYRIEADPLYLEAQYDGTEESMQKWRDKVAEIKLRIVLPE